MNRPSSLSGCARRNPRQERGEKRVRALLGAAVTEFSISGYEAATMSAIAQRAGAPIGSLYQFFPNKQSIARAVRTRHIEDVEERWSALRPEASPGKRRRFVDRFIDQMVQFVDRHPAFLPLLDAPSSTLPVGPRHRLRGQLEQLLLLLQPQLGPSSAVHIAETVMQVNRAMLGLYARSTPENQRWVIHEYRALAHEYFRARLGEPGTSRRDRASPVSRRVTGRRRPPVR